MYKFIVRLLPLLTFVMSRISGLFSQHIKKAIQLTESIKQLIKLDLQEEITVDFFRSYLKEVLLEIPFSLNEALQLISRSFTDILPESVFENIDKRKHYEVIIAGIGYLRSINNKLLLGSYLLNIASWIFIETKDENMKTSEANFLIQMAYTHMKLKKQI